LRSFSSSGGKKKRKRRMVFQRGPFIIAIVLAQALFAAGALPTLPCSQNNQDYTPCTAPWRMAGPAGYKNKAERTHSISAAEVITYSQGSYFMGMVNGGIWRTDDIIANNYTPSWTVVTDNQPVRCAAISAITSWDGTIIAGCGASTSSEMGIDWNEVNAGDWGGLMYSMDNGDTWATLEGFENSFVSDVVIIPKNESQNGETVLVVSTRSHFERKNEGGIFFSLDFGKTWKQSYFAPVFSLARYYDFSTGVNSIYAALPIPGRQPSVVRSTDEGFTWDNFDTNMVFTGDRTPFYPKLDVVQSGKDHIILYVALTVSLSNNSDTFSDLFWVNSSIGTWNHVQNMPKNLDEDRMPKDRCGLLHDPEIAGLVYVVGNANSIAYRVYYFEDKWEKMWQLDTTDFSQPHVDCRNIAWEPIEGSMLVLSDGGIFLRRFPRGPGGNWTSVGGDNTALEVYNVGWDNRNNRWVLGAQDNSVIVSQVGAGESDIGEGIVGGDGTVVSVDNTHCPARLFGCAQFLGGWSYLAGTGDSAVSSSVPITHYFKDLTALPFFLTWFQVNRLNPDSLLFAVNVSDDGVAGLWQFYPIPGPETAAAKRFDSTFHSHYSRVHRYAFKYGVTNLNDLRMILLQSDDAKERSTAKSIEVLMADTAEWPAPTLVEATPNSIIYVFAAGSYVNGNADSNAMAAMNNTHLFTRTSASPSWTTKPLPSHFVEPVDWTNFFDNDQDVVIGPISHGKTVSLALSLLNNSLIAVTGWPYSPLFNMNHGDEHVWVTFTNGDSWVEVTGNLLVATDTIAKARPAGLEFVDDLDGKGTTALLAGTVNGVFVTFLPADGNIDPSSVRWTRFGLCSDLPLTLVPSVVYEPYSDVLVVGTFGRGVYVMENAKQNLLWRYQQQQQSTCNVPMPGKPASNAYLLPPQDSCDGQIFGF